MLLTIAQTHDLLSIIDRNQKVAIGQELGLDFLTEEDKELLEKNGVDLDELYVPEYDTILTSFHFGMLAEAMEQTKTRQLGYEQLRNYISHGDYIPPTVRELATIASVKAQTFNDLKALNGRIFQDVNQILINKGLQSQRAFLKEMIATGVGNKDTVRRIANDIGIKTGDWSRDFDRIVAYTSTLAFEEGKAAMILRNSGQEDPIVYKAVFAGACKHCIRLFLTGDIGSKPRLFKLSELKANGTNIGVKTADWKPTLGPVHPYCRCILNYLPTGYVWNEKTGQFEAPEKGTFVPKRKPIRVWIAGKEQYV